MLVHPQNKTAHNPHSYCTAHTHNPIHTARRPHTTRLSQPHPEYHTLPPSPPHLTTQETTPHTFPIHCAASRVSPGTNSSRCHTQPQLTPYNVLPTPYLASPHSRAVSLGREGGRESHVVRTLTLTPTPTPRIQLAYILPIPRLPARTICCGYVADGEYSSRAKLSYLPVADGEYSRELNCVPVADGEYSRIVKLPSCLVVCTYNRHVPFVACSMRNINITRAFWECKKTSGVLEAHTAVVPPPKVHRIPAPSQSNPAQFTPQPPIPVSHSANHPFSSS